MAFYDELGNYSPYGDVDIYPSASPPTPAPTTAGAVPPQAQPPVVNSQPPVEQNGNFANILQLETGNQHRDAQGNVKIGAKGEVGASQISPATGRNPGFGVTPLRDESEEENRRFGRDYYQAMLKRFGDPVLAAGAYNAGPGRMDRALAKARETNTDVLQYLPASTVKYMENFRALVNERGVPAPATTNQSQDQVQTSSVPVTYNWKDTPAENRSAMAQGAVVLNEDQTNIENLSAIASDPDANQATRQFASNLITKNYNAEKKVAEVSNVADQIVTADTPEKRLEIYKGVLEKNKEPRFLRGLLAFLGGNLREVYKSFTGGESIYEPYTNPNGETYMVEYNEFGQPITILDKNGKSRTFEEVGGVPSLLFGKGGNATTQQGKTTNVPGGAQVDADTGVQYNSFIINGVPRLLDGNGKPPPPGARLISKDVHTAGAKSEIKVNETRKVAPIIVQQKVSEAEGEDFVKKYVPELTADAENSRKLVPYITQNAQIAINNPKIIGTLNAKSGVFSAATRQALVDGIKFGLELKAPAIAELRKSGWTDKDFEDYSTIANNQAKASGLTIKQNLGEARNITNEERLLNREANGDIDKSTTGALLNNYAQSIFNADLYAERDRQLAQYHKDGGRSRIEFNQQWQVHYADYLRAFYAWQSKIAEYIRKDPSDAGVSAAYRAFPMPRINDGGEVVNKVSSPTTSKRPAIGSF